MSFLTCSFFLRRGSAAQGSRKGFLIQSQSTILESFALAMSTPDCGQGFWIPSLWTSQDLIGLAMPQKQKASEKQFDVRPKRHDDDEEEEEDDDDDDDDG